MPFHFRLQPLLKQRDHLLKEAQTALGAAQLRHRDLLDRIRRKQEEINDHWLHWEQKQKEGIDAASHLAFQDYLNVLEQQLQNLQTELQNAADDVARKNGVVLERDKALKMIESLEEQEREAYRYIQAGKEQKKLDEVAIFKNFRDRTATGKDGL